MNLLILMAGSSDKFREAGHTFPKSLVELNGLPLIQHAIENIRSLVQPGDRIVLTLRRDENLRHHTDMVVRLLLPDSIICEVAEATAGAACSALLAIAHIDNAEPLLIANGDQIIHADLPAAIADFRERRLDGGIVVFEDVHPRWSFARTNETGLVVETAEKRPISRLATAGLYYFARGRDFVRATQRMILKDAHVDGSFYICPAFNELLLENARIGVHQIPRSAYFSLATPQDTQAYSEFLKSHPN